EADPARIVDELLREAIELVRGSAGVVTRWDDESQCLLPVAATPRLLGDIRMYLGEGASGRAAELRAPVLLHGGVDAVLARADLSSAVAVPLLHEGRLVGTLSVGRRADAVDAQSGFTN